MACVVFSNEAHARALFICSVLAIIGGLGGIAGGALRKKFDLTPNLSSWRDVPILFFAGVASAFAIALLCKSTGIVYGITDVVIRDISFVCVAFLSGFYSLRLVPIFGDVLEKKVNKLAKDLAEEKKNNTRLRESLSLAQEYAEITAKAEIAFSSENRIDAERALSHIDEGLLKNPKNRKLNIYKGRLLRRLGDLSGAIAALQRYIDLMLSPSGDGNDLSAPERRAIAAAYFNKACYRCLQINANISDGDRRKFLTECQNDLMSAVEYDRRYATEWQEDPDLKTLLDSGWNLAESCSTNGNKEINNGSK